MSATYIVEYAGAPVKFNGLDVPELVTEAKATAFANQPDAWQAVYLAALNPQRCQLVNAHERSLRSPRPDGQATIKNPTLN